MNNLPKLLREVLTYQEVYSLNDLFKIRDALYILDQYNLADIGLLREVEKYIKQKGEKTNDL